MKAVKMSLFLSPFSFNQRRLNSIRGITIALARILKVNNLPDNEPQFVFGADINECHTKANTCEQRCVNVKGSFKCACNDGYQLEAGGRCKLKNAASGIVGKDIASLVFSDKLDIRRVVLDRFEPRLGSFLCVEVLFESVDLKKNSFIVCVIQDA